MRITLHPSVRLRSYWLPTIPVLFAVLILSSCSKSAPPVAKAAAEAPVHVTIGTVELTPMQATIHATGTLEGIHEATIKSETQGRVLKIVHGIGEHVSVGTPLVKVEDALKLVAVQQAEAQRLSAEAALDKAKLDLNRTNDLLKQNAATKNQAELAALQVKSAQAQLESAVAAKALAQKQLHDATILAPIPGIISERFVNQGELLSPGAKVESIVDDSRMKLRLSIGETDIPNVKVGDKVSVTVDAVGKTYLGSVTAISGKADAAHGYEVEVQLPHTSELKSGMFARAEIMRPATKDVPSVPKDAILANAGSSQVYTVVDGIAHLKSIKVGATDSVRAEILDNGLTAGEQVVTFGQSMLHDGSHVAQ